MGRKKRGEGEVKAKGGRKENGRGWEDKVRVVERGRDQGEERRRKMDERFHNISFGVTKFGPVTFPRGTLSLM